MESVEHISCFLGRGPFELSAPQNGGKDSAADITAVWAVHGGEVDEKFILDPSAVSFVTSP